MDAQDLVLVTSGYRLIALNKTDGSQVWETVLVTSFFKPMDPFITLLVEESGVYAHVNNEMFRIDLSSGNILWRKTLPSRKWINTPGIASIATLEAGVAFTANQAAHMRANRKAQSGPD